jgi:hypothetical protein
VSPKDVPKNASDAWTTAKNSLALVSPAGEGAAHDVTPLQQLLALTRRSDSVAVKSEGTRVLVNVIKSLWSNDSTLGDQRKQAMGAVVTPPCAQALAQMVGRSKKYPILINEGVVALTLMSTHAQGGQSPCLMTVFVLILTMLAQAPSSSTH